MLPLTCRDTSTSKLKINRILPVILNVIQHQKRKKKKEKTGIILCHYSTFISLPFGFVFAFLLKVISRIPLLYVDFTVSISAS
jgi:hypothetical protein